MHLRGVIFLALLLFWLPALGQGDQEEVSLLWIVEQLEDHYGVSFNYNPRVLEGKQLQGFSLGTRLSEDLQKLEAQTDLQFEMLSGNFVSITTKLAGGLCGYLKDKDSGQPIAFATIRTPKGATITDEQGYFELEGNSGLIEIRYLGYKTIMREAKYFAQDRCGTVYMFADAQSLEQIVLTGYLIEGMDKLNDGSYNIDFDQFTILPGLIETDVLQTVQALPGIQSVSETVSNINIRGGTHDQNLILWDGIKMYQSGHFFGLIAAFNPLITQEVSLVKSGTSAARSDGVSGTIDMRTDARVNGKLNGSIGANLINVDGFIDLPLGPSSSIQLAGRKSLSDWWKTPTYDAYFDRISQDTEVIGPLDTQLNTDQQFDFYDASLRWLFDPTDKDRIRLNLIYVNNELIFNENALVGAEQTSKQSSLSQNSFGAGLSYQRRWNEAFSTDLQIYETDYQLQAINENLELGQRFYQENEVSETGVTLSGTWEISDKLRGSLGYQFIETGVTNLDEVDLPRFKVLVAEVVRTHAPFTQWEYQAASGTYLSAGLRYNYLDKFKSSRLEPRLAINQELGDNWNVQGSVEWKQQVTSQVINFQNDFLGVEKRRWQLADNDSIPVIKSRQAALGLSFEDGGWLVSLEGYQKQVDGITAQSQGFQGPYEFEKSSGTYKVIGADLLMRKAWRDLRAWLSYSWMDNQYEFPDLQASAFPSNLDITHSITAGLSYTYDAFKIAAGINWRNGKPYTQPDPADPVVDGTIQYQAVNQERLDEYLSVDASVLYTFGLSGTQLETGLAVWNLIDLDNTLEQYYRLDVQDQLQTFQQQALGWTPQALLRWKF